MTHVTRSINEQIRTGLSREEIWEAEDKGLIHCWETGRELSQSKPELAKAANNGELPVTHWKGGVSRTLKKLDKFGAHHYLAQWQGLCGRDLDIDTTQEVTIICSKTGMVVTFTSDINKLIDANTEETEEEADHGRPAPRVSEQPLFSSSPN